MYVRKESLHFCRCAHLRPSTDWYQKPTSQLKTVIIIAFIGELGAPCYMIGICHDYFAEGARALTAKSVNKWCTVLRSIERLRESLTGAVWWTDRVMYFVRETHTWLINNCSRKCYVEFLRGKRASKALTMFQWYYNIILKK